MSKRAKKPEATKAPKLQQVAELTGLALLTCKVADDEDPDRIGLSFRSLDSQELNLEIATSKEIADQMGVDKTYNIVIAKGAHKEYPTFTVVHSNEVDGGPYYHEKMVVKGDIDGHVYTRILPNQEDMFFEEKQNHIAFVPVDVD
jgi:hypothetical protein